MSSSKLYAGQSTDAAFSTDVSAKKFESATVINYLTGLLLVPYCSLRF